MWSLLKCFICKMTAAHWPLVDILCFIDKYTSLQGGLRGPQPPSTKKKKERERREDERKKKEKEKINQGERKLNQSFQEHVFMGLW